MNLDIGDTQLIIRTAKEHELLRNQLAYVLATTYHETGRTMKPVRETFGKNDAQVIARLDTAWSGGRMPWVRSRYWAPDFEGKSWYGRGYVQLTHRDNYERAGDKLNVNLVDDPDMALDPGIAAQILVKGMQEGWFTGKKLSDYITLQKSDYFDARRIVNGLDRAAIITNYAKAYDKELVKIGYGVDDVKEEPQEPQDEDDFTDAEILMAIYELLKERFG